MPERELQAEWRRLQEAVDLETDDDRALDLYRELEVVTDHVLALDRARLQEDNPSLRDPAVDAPHPQETLEELCNRRRDLEGLIAAEVDPEKQYTLRVGLYDLLARILAASRQETAVVEDGYRELKEAKRRED